MLVAFASSAEALASARCLPSPRMVRRARVGPSAIERRPEMLVVMQAEASPAEIDAVCQRARDAGFEATVYDGEPAVIMVAGEHAAEAAEQFADLPGVARIAHPRSSAAAGDQQPAHRRHPPPGAAGDPGRAAAAPRRGRGHGAAHAPGGEPHPARGGRPPDRRRRPLLDPRPRRRARLRPAAGAARRTSWRTTSAS